MWARMEKREPPGPHRLGNGERWAGLLGALIALALAALLIYSPPEVKEAGGEQCRANQDCGVIEVSADTENVAIVLVLLGGAGLLVSLLGIRFNRITARDFSMEAMIGEVARGAQPGKGTVKWVNAEESEREWEKLPAWAQYALNGWAEAGSVLTRQVRRSIVSVEREGKRRAWLVTLHLDDGSRSTLRLSYGRGSTRIADQPD
jgi:hypothetical protein